MTPTPHLASVHVTGRERYLQEVSARRHVLRSDEPPAAGGADAGPTPVELLLSGLGACTATTLRMYAERKGWELGEIHVEVRLVEEGGAQRIERRIRLGAALADEQRRRLLEIAEKTPVTRMVREGVEIVTRPG